MDIIEQFKYVFDIEEEFYASVYYETGELPDFDLHKIIDNIIYEETNVFSWECYIEILTKKRLYKRQLNIIKKNIINKLKTKSDGKK